MVTRPYALAIEEMMLHLNFSQSLDALGTQVNAHAFTLFVHHPFTLNVRIELATSGTHREAAGVTEHRFLPTIATNSHDSRLKQKAFADETGCACYHEANDMTSQNKRVQYAEMNSTGCVREDELGLG